MILQSEYDSADINSRTNKEERGGRTEETKGIRGGTRNGSDERERETNGNYANYVMLQK